MKVSKRKTKETKIQIFTKKSINQQKELNTTAVEITL